MFPETTELLVIGYLTESIWNPKIQIKFVDTKNQLADILTKVYQEMSRITFFVWSVL